MSEILEFKNFISRAVVLPTSLPLKFLQLVEFHLICESFITFPYLIKPFQTSN